MSVLYYLYLYYILQFVVYFQFVFGENVCNLPYEFNTQTFVKKISRGRQLLTEVNKLH
jgi:hypothetical protein